MKLIHTNKFEANRWLITARWFYAPAIFAMGLLSKLDPLQDTIFPLPIMIFMFSVFILINVLFWQISKRLELKNKIKHVRTLGTSQILSELLFFLIILHLSGGVESVAPIFFFIPIVSSIILFSPIGSLFIAFVAALIVNGIVFLEYYGLTQKIYGYTGKGILEYDDLLVKLSSSIIITAVYFIVGSLSGYLSSALRKRELQIIEGRRQAQLQADKLRLLNEEYNSFARKLIRKDLELKKENEEIVRFDREKKEFVSTVAHQLRTPLSAIKWTLDMLLQDEINKMTSDQRALLMKAYESNERIINLIQDMLGAEKAEARADNFAPVEISLSDLVGNIIPDFRSGMENKNIKIEIQSEKDLPRVNVDPQKMRAVYQNLIENAVKYSKPGGTIKINMDSKNGKVRVSIADEGIGIPPKEQDNIFKKFFRAQNAVSTDPNGSGLGLFIVKSIIERHNGTIEFKSQENKGTIFTFYLPVAETQPLS